MNFVCQNNFVCPVFSEISCFEHADQWSPTNQTGKKVYGRDFLVALQSDPKSKVKPNLPDMDVVLKEGANRVNIIKSFCNLLP